jgi:anthranilate/para-aminobenzoate synthase component I
MIYFNVGAGIVSDSSPRAEWEETLAKGRGFMQALHLDGRSSPLPHPRSKAAG